MCFFLLLYTLTEPPRNLNHIESAPHRTLWPQICIFWKQIYIWLLHNHEVQLYYCIIRNDCVLKRKPKKTITRTCDENVVLQQLKARGEDWSYPRKRKKLKRKVKGTYNNHNSLGQLGLNRNHDQNEGGNSRYKDVFFIIANLKFSGDLPEVTVATLHRGQIKVVTLVV